MSDQTLRSRVDETLEALADRGDLDAGAVRSIQVEEGEIRVSVRPATGRSAEAADVLRRELAGLEGAAAVRVEVEPRRGEPGSQEEPDGPGGRELPVLGQGGGAGTPGSGGGPPSGGGGPEPTPAQRQEEASRHPRDAEPIDGVDRVVAVSSGKGGVGKSTVATNLAAAWARAGHRVGLLDADIYGPDIPTMFGVYDRPRMSGEEVVPLEAHGVKLMSIGFLVDEDTPAIWRGPIIMGVVRQFIRQVQWGELDYLVVDLPPGTGDAQLSLVQLCQVTGAVMVTTPQDVAVGGVLKGIRMFERLEVPVAGVVENMRGFVCPDCGTSHEIFGSGGGERLSASLDLEFLGAVPLGMAVREEGDRGIPTALGRPDSPEGEAFRAMAERTAARMDELHREAERAGETAGDEAGPDGGGDEPSGGGPPDGARTPAGAAGDA